MPGPHQDQQARPEWTGQLSSSGRNAPRGGFPTKDPQPAAVSGAALAVLVCFLFLAAAAVGQISPGPLSQAHSSLSGATNCTSCHRLGSQATFKCLECHTEIATRIASGRGLHARVVAKTAGSQTCASCHSEHNGERFQLIKWEPSLRQFDHSKTGWALEGKHAGLDCARCHTAAHVAPAEKAFIRVKDLNRTYLGTSRDCVTCHTDPHKGQLGQQCQQCHSANDWKTVNNFDHSRTRFVLTGAHSKTACEKCHTPSEPGGQPRWTGLAFDRCTSCHSDPHHGSFANTCESCHSTVAWKAVSMAAVNNKFDHSRTKYPLLGKHLQVGCEQCHAGGDFKKPIAFQKCADCHRPDPHGGQFLKRADGGECASCHTVEGFKPAKFTVSDHARVPYPLQGKHASVECAKCHIPAGKATLYMIKYAQCTDCHKDIHRGQFAAAPNLNRCENCHNVNGFKPSTFALASHKNSRFPLLGAHLATPCGDCHKAGLSPQFKDVALFRFDDRSCTACHQDPHQGQFRDRTLKLTAAGKPAGCEACHSLSSWHELSRFDHAATKFPLQGAHRAVACADCHRPPKLEVKLIDVDFRSAPLTCEGCHQDIHGGQFASAAKQSDCASCHNSNKWKPALFDHNTRAAFSLEGVHKDVRCARCHTNIKLVGDQNVLFYKPTPKECSACHGPSPAISGRTAAGL